MRRASAFTWTTSSATARSRASKKRSPTGADRLTAPRGALAPPFLRIEQQRPVDLHAIAVGKRRVGAHALAEDAERSRVRAGGDAGRGDGITHRSAGR